MSKLKSIAKQKRRQCRQERRAEKARKKKRAFLKTKNIEKYRSDESKQRIIKKQQEEKRKVLMKAMKEAKPSPYKIKKIKLAWRKIVLMWWKMVWRVLTKIFHK